MDSRLLLSLNEQPGVHMACVFNALPFKSATSYLPATFCLPATPVTSCLPATSVTSCLPATCATSCLPAHVPHLNHLIPAFADPALPVCHLCRTLLISTHLCGQHRQFHTITQQAAHTITGITPPLQFADPALAVCLPLVQSPAHQHTHTHSARKIITFTHSHSTHKHAHHSHLCRTLPISTITCAKHRSPPAICRSSVSSPHRAWAEPCSLAVTMSCCSCRQCQVSKLLHAWTFECMMQLSAAARACTP